MHKLKTVYLHDVQIRVLYFFLYTYNGRNSKRVIPARQSCFICRGHSLRHARDCNLKQTQWMIVRVVETLTVHLVRRKEKPAKRTCDCSNRDYKRLLVRTFVNRGIRIRRAVPERKKSAMKFPIRLFDRCSGTRE